MKIRIAIDGPSGAGKSSIAKALASRLKIEYVDTGALYRTVAYIAKTNKLDDKIEELIKKLQENTIEVLEGKVFLNGKRIEDEIRTEEISHLSSKLSKVPKIREELLYLQKDLANRYSLVMEGRDIGSIVIPDAEFKFYLTASPEIRSQRRYRQLLEKGESIDFQQVYKEIIDRDHRDSTREIAPLLKVEDAISIDSGHLSEEEVLETMYKIIKESLGDV